MKQLQVISPLVRLGHDSSAHVGVAQLILELVDAERGVERHQHGTAIRRGQEGNYPLRPVREVDGQPIAQLDTQPAERVGERQRVPLHLRVAHPA